VGPACGVLPCMGETDWTFRKPYDLRERLLDFASAIVRLSQFLHSLGGIAAELSGQLVNCGTSAGANWEEADDGSSDRDTLAKMRITLRELKETRFRLRVLRSSSLLTSEHDQVIAESDELVRIVATVIRRRATGR
jgi:four helix bundle protein